MKHNSIILLILIFAVSFAQSFSKNHAFGQIKNTAIIEYRNCRSYTKLWVDRNSYWPVTINHFYEIKIMTSDGRLSAFKENGKWVIIDPIEALDAMVKSQEFMNRCMNELRQ